MNKTDENSENKIHDEMKGGYSYERTNILLKWIGTNKIVLDIGCYDGSDSKKILKQGNDVYGIEIYKVPCEISRSKGIKVYNFDVDMEKNWPFDEEMFDVIIAGEIIEHVSNPDELLNKIHKHLKKNGMLILTTPNIASIGRRIMLLFGKNPFIEISSIPKINRFPPVGHVRYYTKKDILRQLKFHMFEIDEITSDRLNLGILTSKFLARIFPTLSFRFIIKAYKIEYSHEK